MATFWESLQHTVKKISQRDDPHYSVSSVGCGLMPTEENRYCK